MFINVIVTKISSFLRKKCSHHSRISELKMTDRRPKEESDGNTLDSESQMDLHVKAPTEACHDIPDQENNRRLGHASLGSIIFKSAKVLNS